ncbi:hypothetical protein PG984_010408 [Apiospora sp. TS-2023a]
MSMPGNQPPMSEENQRRLATEGYPVICFGQLTVTLYRRLFDPTYGLGDLYANFLCIGLGHMVTHFRTLQPTTPADLPPPPASFGIARQVIYYATRRRTLMHLNICARSHAVALSLRHLLPLLPRLFLVPGAATSLVRLAVTPSRWPGAVMELSGRRLPALALTALGTAAGCWAVSTVGTFSDVDTLYMIQNPEEDERRNLLANTPEWQRQLDHRFQGGMVIMFVVACVIRNSV